MLGPLAKFFGALLVVLVAVGLLLALLSAVGTAFALAITLGSILLFKVAPLALLCWIVYKIARNWKPRGQITASDEAWLQGRR
ncbi:MAG: hypothetical protein OYK82_04880 [Gammaproteobacteria bacterium]|nr:hypothetical protein [Gammaproteobacteria bacterium]